MSKKIYHYIKNPFSIKQHIGHLYIILLVGLGFFSIVQTIFAQTTTGFLVANTGDYITTKNYGTINFSGIGLPSIFQRSWNNLTTTFYEPKPNGNTIYFNNFDTPEVLEQNQVPLADSIRDFPNENFTNGTIGIGNNGWSYLYKYKIQSGVTTYIYPYYYNSEICLGVSPPATSVGETGTDFLYPTDDISGTDGRVCERIGDFLPTYSSDIILVSYISQRPHPLGDWECERTCTSIETEQTNTQNIFKMVNLTFNQGNGNSEGMRTIGTGPITAYNFANIGKKYSHPGSGMLGDPTSGYNNIPVIQQRTSNLSGKIKIINKIQDDENNCGSGIIYKIYTGIIENGDTLTGVKSIKTHYLPNLSGATIERSGNIRINENVFFEIDNSGDNQCDGTMNWIQIYDITDNAEINGGPSYTTTSTKYGGALDFTGNQLYSLGTGINQSSSGITIAAWIKTRNENQSQGIITKKFSYGIVLKQGTLRISPSTYWMRHDTGIPISGNTRTHVAWTYNGSTMRAYKNGSQIRTYNINGELNENESEVMIGYDELNHRGRNGQIDEFRMYDTTFTTGQIQELYESNLKLVDSGTNSSWNFIINKTGLVDGNYNYGIIGSIPEITGSILVDQNGPILTGSTGRSIYESQPLTLTTTWYDSGMSRQLTTGFDRGRGWDLNGPWDIATNGENIMDFGTENEPISKQIRIRVKDHVGNISYKTGTIFWLNTGPVINDTNHTYTGIVEDTMTFIASGYDIGNEPLRYQRYNGTGCFYSSLIQGESGSTFSKNSQTETGIYFSYKIIDTQGLSSCWSITGQRETPDVDAIVPSNNSGSYMEGISARQTPITGTIIFSGNIGTCTGDNEYTYYIGTGIGNDYCIVQNGENQIVLGRYGVNKYLTLFSQTGTRINPYLINENIQPFIIEFQNTNLTGFARSVSGTNNNRKVESQIYNSGLIGLYNFDKILLTDSEKDFSAIQSGKNRSYWRRPKGTGIYELLQYYAPSQQRIISTPIEEFDGLFIEKNELNPGYNYGDTILGRTSPVNSTIEIQYTLTDANTSCGDGIQYKLLKNNTTTVLATGAFESKSVITHIASGDTIYLVVNSLNNNDCDNTNYNIKIYQLPESNLGTKGNYQGTNSGALYTTGKYNGALSFPENSYITIGTGIQSGHMSISARIYKSSGNQQTIIQKRGSYGMVVFNNTLQVANQNTIRRYDTQISLPDDTRTHVGRSYDGTTMKVYINGKQQRSNTVVGTIPSNNYPVYVGYSFSNGQRNGSIDEMYIYNYAIDSGVFASLYNHNLNRIAWDRWQRKSNQSGSIYDGRYYFETKVNGIPTNTGEIIRDFSTPLFTGFVGLTGRESTGLMITGFSYDSGYYISGYQFRYNITGERSNRSNISTGNSFTINKQDEPITGLVEIKITDFFGHETIGTGIIERINTGPVIVGDNNFYGKLGENIALIASGYDIDGGPLTYQRHTGDDCKIDNQIFGKTGSTLITGSTITGTTYFSYKIFDKQGSGTCFNISGTRSEDTMFINNTEYFIGDGNGGIISGEIFPQGLTIIENAKYGKCLLTGDTKEIINYIPNTGSKENDSCIVELIHSIYTVAAFTNINTGFSYSRIPEITGITKDIRNIIRKGILQTPVISSFTGTWKGETAQSSGILTNNININTNNLIRKYSFDTIEITDSTKDFGYFPGEHGRKYLWNNGTSGGELVFNPITKSRIINEPLQNYEYIFINNGSAYPGATKYGDIIYERTSNITGNINIETTIDNANTSSCPSSDGIIYQIKKETTTLYTKDYENTKTIANDIQTTGTSISYGDKLLFIINSKNNNQCDKIDFNVKIYQNETNDYSLSGQNLTDYGATTINNGRYFGSYTFGPTPHQYIDIGNIKKEINLTFSTWIKTSSTADQTIIYKQGSYGLAIKDGELKVTTDGARRYSTNAQTINTLTNSLRNHLVRTYDGTNMYIYINGQQTRSGRIVGYYPLNDNPTIIGRNTNHGQFNGSLDELQVWNKTLSSSEIQNLYNTQLSKIDSQSREFSLIQTGLADGRYMFTGYINGRELFTGATIIDNDPPILEVEPIYTGNEGTGIIVTISGWDNGVGEISGYQYSLLLTNGNPYSTRSTGRITGNTILIPSQNEPISGILTILAKDSLGHQTGTTTIIQWNNVKIIATDLINSGNETSNLSFTASGSDPGGTTSTGYQWYIGNNCLGTIIFSGKTFTTGRNEPITENFSYTMTDKQGLSGTCGITTGIRENIIPTAQDLFRNANGNTEITFTASGYDPGGTIFSATWYKGNECTGTPISTNIDFTTGSFQSGTRAFSYYLLDNKGATGTNNGRLCQIATGYRPHINPIAHDFTINSNTANIPSTSNRRLGSEARDSEFNLPVNANISSGSKGYCQLNNDWISFQPNTNQTGTGFCELRLTDNNNGITYIKAYALNIDTTPPQTNSSGTNETTKLIYNDTSTGTTYYKILTGVWNSSSCGNSGYTTYNSGTTITIPYMSGFNDNKTLCYYSIDVHGNSEPAKSELFNQDTAKLSASVSSNIYMNTLFQATISVNKACSGVLTGLYLEQPIVFATAGTYSITGSFLETSGPKTAYIFLQTNNPEEGTFSYNNTFTIDQIAPSTPVITENLQYNDYYSIKRSLSTDLGAGILGYNYQISNEGTIIKNGFTEVNYLNIFKSEIQNNSQISIKVQAQDKVNNISSRSTPTTITASSQQTTTIDTIPNQFTFTKVTNAKRDTEYTSDEIVIGGLSTNTIIPITLSNGTLFINDTNVTNSGTVKNGDIVYIKLDSSDTYSETTKATLLANNIAATYNITTESKNSGSTTSFLDELKKLLEQLKDEDTTEPTTSTGIDTKWISAPYIAPNGKTYNLYKTLDGKYSAYNFIYKKTFNSLTELKQYINKNNPR